MRPRTIAALVFVLGLAYSVPAYAQTYCGTDVSMCSPGEVCAHGYCILPSQPEPQQGGFGGPVTKDPVDDSKSPTPAPIVTRDTPVTGTPTARPVTGTPSNSPVTGTPAGAPVTGTPSDSGETLVNPLKVNSLEGLLNLLLDAVIRIGSIVLVLMLIWVGFMFVTSRGNEEKIRTARNAFMWTIIGGLILLGAKGIQSVISATVNTL
jgi:hypothetical protein